MLLLIANTVLLPPLLFLTLVHRVSLLAEVFQLPIPMPNTGAWSDYTLQQPTTFVSTTYT